MIKERSLVRAMPEYLNPEYNPNDLGLVTLLITLPRPMAIVHWETGEVEKWPIEQLEQCPEDTIPSIAARKEWGWGEYNIASLHCTSIEYTGSDD